MFRHFDETNFFFEVLTKLTFFLMFRHFDETNFFLGRVYILLKSLRIVNFFTRRLYISGFKGQKSER